MSIQTDFKYMINEGVYQNLKIINFPPNRCLIDSKRVFKKKIYGQLRAGLVARGYTHIPIVDFTRNYSPVVNNVPMHAILLMWLNNKCYSQTIDVEIASYTQPQKNKYT